MDRLRKAFQQPEVIAPALRREAASLLQRLQLVMDQYVAVHERRRGGQTRVFSFDVHPSVIADLAIGWKRFDSRIVNWNISSHNWVHRKVQIAPDPVQVVNAYTWKDLDENLIDAFRAKYSRFLKTFDGFIVDYPLAFSQIYDGLERSILAVAATRYEFPYSLRSRAWHGLDKCLRKLHAEGLLTLAANNKGDRDYLRHFTDLSPVLVPSVCDYHELSWSPPATNLRVVFSRNAKVEGLITGAAGSTWTSYSGVFGQRFTWRELRQCAEIFYVPYNVSTMMLFELATAGIPVTVPSRGLLRNWRQQGLDVLAELSFFQVLDAGTQHLAIDDPNNYSSPRFYDWWLDRADFYDSNLMPNVRVVDSIAEAVLVPHPVTRYAAEDWNSMIQERNEALRLGRHRLLQAYLNQL